VRVLLGITVNAAIVFAAGGIATLLTRRPSWLRALRYQLGTALGALAITLGLDATTPAAAPS